MRSSAALPVLVTLLGCAPREHIVLDDVGRVCAFEPGSLEFDPSAPQSFAADAPLTVRVLVDECPLGCNEDFDARCTVERTGNTLRVTSQGSWTQSDPDLACAAVCAPVIATCETGPLEAGTYTVELGDEEMTVEVPGDVPEPPCAINARS
jgi:hypothetical protein